MCGGSFNNGKSDFWEPVVEVFDKDLLKFFRFLH